MKKKILLTLITLLMTCITMFSLTACGDTKISFKLNFVVDNEIYATIDTSGDEVIALPENPTKENHSFDGWFWDKDVWEKPFTANSLLDAPLSSDMSVYAKFSLNTINGVTFEDIETTYDGTEKTIAVSNLPNGASVVYDKANTYTNAGEYTVTATISQENHEDLQLTATLTINKATYDMSGVVFTDKIVTYNSESHSITATNLPDGVTAQYTGNNQINAGEYTVTATFTGDSVNYELIANKTVTLTISKATYDMSSVVFADKTVTYNGESHSITASNLPDGVTAQYTGNNQINANEYAITATFSGDDANYEPIANKTATLTINKVSVSKPAQDSTSFVYNGNEQTYQIIENSLYTISGNKQINAGNYNVIISLKDKNNYQWNDENTNDLSYSFNIAKAVYEMSEVVFADKTVTYNGETHSIIATGMPNGVTVTYENNEQVNANVYTVIAKFTGDSNNYELIPNKTATLTILDSAFEGLSFESKTFTYDGTEKKIEVVGAPSDATITYNKANKYINAGEYTITATIKKANYVDVSLTATLTINKATYDMSQVVFADKTVTYNGNAYSIEAQNVPSGLSVSYTGNNKINVDNYTVTAIFADTTGNYNNPENMTAKLVINKATITGITLTDKTFTYDTKTHALKIDGTLPTCVNVTYENNDKVNANTYTVTVSFEDTSGNYIVPENMSAKLIINKATVSGITFENKTFTYNGTKRNLEISGTLPNEVTVNYVNNGKINANTYYVTATFSCETDNYIVPEDMTAKLTIKKAVYDMSNVTFENKTVTYDGKTHSLAVSGNLPNGVSVSYSNNDKINANQYIVTATFTGDSINYYEIDGMQAMLTINKATYDMSGVSFVGGRFTYDGTQKFIYITGELPNGVTVNYTNNGKINANTYTVTATFTGDTDNYNKLADWTASLIIDKATYDMTGISFKNQTFTYDATEKNALITGTLPNGVEVSYVGNGKTDVGTYNVTAKFNGDSNNYYLIEDMTATFKINQAVPYIKEVSCNNTLNIYSTVELVADTNVAGVLVFDKGQVLTIGYKTYSWTFIPEDTHNYTTATGTVGLTVCALVSYYNDGVLFSSQNIVLNNSATVPMGTPLKVDSDGYRYTFSHWSIEENGAEYNFTNAITADLNLYAVYDNEEIVYAINYYDTKGVEHENIATYTVSTQYTLLDIEKEHYVFDGWTDKEGNEITKINKGTFGTLNIYATWTPVKYLINYEIVYRGAQSNAVSLSYTVEDSINFANATYDEYHTFAGWYLDKDYETAKSSISVGEFGDITLYAKWDFSGTYIYTSSQLQQVAYNMSGIYELKTNINLTNKEFTAIGDATNPFKGYFNGADFSINGKMPFGVNNGTIKNLKSNTTIVETNKGTLSYCSGGKGLAIVNSGTINFCDAVGYALSDNDCGIGMWVGGLVVNNSGVISNSCSNMTITNYSSPRIGGIAADSSGKIYNCYSNIYIQNSYEGIYSINCIIGGLVSELTYGGVIENCYATGKIDIKSEVDYSGGPIIGGLVGEANRYVENSSKNSIIKNCFSDCEIKVWSRCYESRDYCKVVIGGISGVDGDLNNCYSDMKIECENYNCYWEEGNYSAGKNGSLTSEYNLMSVNFLRQKLKWDESIWYLQDGQLPKLRFEME